MCSHCSHSKCQTNGIMKGTTGNHVAMMTQQFQNGAGQLHHHPHHHHQNQHTGDIAPPPPSSQPPSLLDEVMHGLTLAEVHYQEQQNTQYVHQHQHNQQQQQLPAFDLDRYHQQLQLYQQYLPQEDGVEQCLQTAVATATADHNNHHHHNHNQLSSSAQTHHQHNHQHQQQQHLHRPEAVHSQSSSLGVARLLEDLQRLLEQDRDSADIIFLVGDTPVYAHRAILKARCQSFQNVKRGEICIIFGTTVSSTNAGNNISGTSTIIRWPQANAAALRTVLFYVYTGKIEEVNENVLFEALAIGYELGVDELVSVYEEHFSANITVSSVCTCLDGVLAVKKRIGENDWNRMIASCLAFFREHAAECVKTPSFLNLSKPAITHLVSSDYFSLNEADIFRSVLKWAQHQTGIQSSFQKWSAIELGIVRDQLSGVIDHIRVLLIDSQVFAEEFEPIGVVPIELSLERYRFAALSAAAANGKNGGHFKGDAVSSKRVQARLSPLSSIKQTVHHHHHQQQHQHQQPHQQQQPQQQQQQHFFHNSKLLTDDERSTSLEKEQTLNRWYGQPKQQWRCVFRASAHDFSAEAFHAHCDGVTPTFTLVRGSQGHLSGGFSDVAWSRGDGKGRGRYAPSEAAFLFTLGSSSDQHQAIPARFDVKKKMFAIAHHANSGPVFGAGADLSISDRCHLADGGSYSNLPHSYDGENASNETLFGDYNFTVVDYEVFTLAE